MSRRVVLVGALALLLLAAVVGVGLAQNGAETTRVETVADGLEVPGDFELISAETTPATLFCFSGGCPSVERRWAAPVDLSTQEFVRLYREAGWSLELEDACEADATSADPSRRSCTASGRVEGRSVQMTYRPSVTGPHAAELVLFVT